MTSLRRDGPGQAINRPAKAGFAFFLCVSLALAHPAGAAAADTLAGTEPLPPPGTYFSAYVSDSATGLPLAGADLNIRNPQALFTVTHTDSGGWAHVAPSGLPYYGPGSIQAQWVTASYPGYVAQMAICGAGATSNRVLRFAMSRASAKNSITLTGTLIDSANHAPIPRLSIDFSHSELSGWMTYVITTDDSGKFIITGIPVGHSVGYFWVRSTKRGDYFLQVPLTQGNQTIIVYGLPATSLVAPRVELRTSRSRKPGSHVLFRSRNRDATGRWRDSIFRDSLFP